MSQKTSGSQVTTVSNQEEREMDPGGIFLFAPDSHIHECLRLLPPMPPHLPVLRRGMKIYFNNLIYYGLLLPGSTAAHSKRNLIQ